MGFNSFVEPQAKQKVQTVHFRIIRNDNILNTYLTYSIAILCVFFIVITSFRSDALAQIKIGDLETFISVKSFYNSNENFDPDDELETYSFVLTPALTLNFPSRPQYFLRTQILINIWRYLDEQDLDRVEQFYSIDGAYKFSDRLELPVNFFFQDANVQNPTEAALEGASTNVTRKLAGLSQRKYLLGTGLTYQLSRLSTAGIRYDYLELKWDDPQNDDYNQHGIIFSYDYRFKNQIDSIRVTQNSYLRDSENTDRDYYDLSLGWSRELSEPLLLNMSLGGSYENIRFKDDGEVVTNVDPVAEISLSKKDQIFSWILGYSSKSVSTTNGDIYLRNRIFWSPRIMVGRSLSVFCLFDYIRPDTITGDESSGQDWALSSQYFALEPAVNYAINNDWNLSLAGDYTVYPEAERERLRAWIVLKYKFDSLWQ